MFSRSTPGKVYGRVANFDDLEPLTARTARQQTSSSDDENEPWPFSREGTISFSHSRGRKKCLVIFLLSLLALLVVAVALGIGVPFALSSSEGSNGREKCSLDPMERFDCLPGLDSTNKTFCTSLGCCWEEKKGSPSCFYSLESGYTMSSEKLSLLGKVVTLEGGEASPYGPPIPKLTAEFQHETDSRLHIRVSPLEWLVWL